MRAVLWEKGGATPRFHLPLTQRQIGSCVGITPIHVNRTVRGLREAGIVVVEGKAATILDRDRLVRLAEGRAAPGRQ